MVKLQPKPDTFGWILFDLYNQSNFMRKIKLFLPGSCTDRFLFREVGCLRDVITVYK